MGRTKQKRTQKNIALVHKTDWFKNRKMKSYPAKIQIKGQRCHESATNPGSPAGKQRKPLKESADGVGT